MARERQNTLPEISRFGRRVRRTLSGGTSNDTLYPGDVEISPATASGTGAASRSVTVYPYPGARVVTTQTRAAGATTWVTGASTRLTMHRDTLKSVSAESFASGTNINTLARRTFYAPYGETLSEAASNNAPADSKGWIGERAEPVAGLIYLNARLPIRPSPASPDRINPIRSSPASARISMVMPVATPSIIAIRGERHRVWVGSSERCV